MKVLQIIDSLPATSGGSRFVVNLTKKLNTLNIDTSLLLIDGKNSHFVEEVIDNEIDLIKLDENTSSRYKLKYIKQIAKIMDNYDIIHVHIFPTSYMVALASFFTKKKSKIVFTEHNSYNKRATNFIFRFFEKFIYNRFKHIVCLSDQVYCFVKKNLNTRDNKLTIIENAIDIDVITNSKAYTKIQLGYEDTDNLLLMSARLNNQKNHRILLQTMVLLPSNFHLLLAGDGVLYNELVELTKSLSIENRVKFLGSRKDVFSLIKSVDLNILCSNFEGLSLAALESMASGKPFIASNVDGLDFVVKDERLLFKNEPQDISKMILNLFENKNWYNKVSEISFNRAHDFDFKIMTKKYIDVYIRVMNEK